MTDSELLCLYERRDETAIAATAEHYGKRLFSLAAHILHDCGAAEECVNDTYLKAWLAIPPAKPVHLAAYLLQITRRTAFERLEKASAEKRCAPLTALTDELAQCLPDRLQTSPPDELETKERITAFLATLTDDARRIFLRRYWFADSVQEIAARYRISESKVKTSLHRSRNRLRLFLEKEDTTV